MQGCLIALFIISITCSVKSDDDNEPSLHILAKSHAVYNVNETKAIFCKGQNIVEPIQWYSPSGQLVEERSTKNNRIFVEGKIEKDDILSILIIHNIDINDGGNWTCRAGNLSETREFIVGEKVIILNKYVEIEGEENKTVKLTCEAKGYPPPVVTWYKGTQLIKDKVHSKKYHIKPDHSLEIRNLNHADAGLYTCKVRQESLSHYTEKNIQLSVQHKPILYNSDTEMIYTSQRYKTEEIYAILNDTKNVTCSAIANPPPTYRWFRRHESFDEPITDPDTVITSEDGNSSVLVLRMYNETYFGQYKCSVNNIKGTESIIFHVTPGSRPDPPDSVSLFRANTTTLVFNVSCSTCIFPEGEEVATNPSAVLSYSFQLVEAKEGYGPDWTIANEYEVKVYSNNTLYAVSSLPNSTAYYVQVRTRNAAGYSDWVGISGKIATASDAITLSATIILLIATSLFTRVY